MAQNKRSSLPGVNQEEVMLLMLAKPDALPYSNPFAVQLRHICLLQKTIK